MVNLIIHDHRRPSEPLAQRIAKTVIEDPIEQEGLAFLLLGHHRKIHKLLRDYPNAFKDFRSTGNGEDDDGLVIY